MRQTAPRSWKCKLSSADSTFLYTSDNCPLSSIQPFPPLFRKNSHKSPCIRFDSTPHFPLPLLHLTLSLTPPFHNRTKIPNFLSWVPFSEVSSSSSNLLSFPSSLLNKADHFFTKSFYHHNLPPRTRITCYYPAGNLCEKTSYQRELMVLLKSPYSKI